MMRRILSLLFFIACLGSYASALVVTPSNIQLPNGAGETFSFDLIAHSNGDISQGFQATFSISGPGALSMNSTSSTMVSGESSYWLFNNATGPEMIDNGSSSFSFGDAPDDALAQTLSQGDVLARYSFIFDGPTGWYTFTIDLDTLYSFTMNESFGTDPIGFDKGGFQGTETSFDVYIPEPTSLILLCVGGFLVRRK